MARLRTHNKRAKRQRDSAPLKFARLELRKVAAFLDIKPSALEKKWRPGRFSAAQVYLGDIIEKAKR